MNKIYIVDGNSLLFRAYFATYAMSNGEIMRAHDGTPTNAVFAFSNMINKMLQNLKEGDGLFVGFDTGKATFRHKEDEKYKANRKPCPPDLKTQMPLARSFLDSLNIFWFEKEGWEADDICGTVAKMAGAQGKEVIVYTSDRDFLQLIDKHISIHIIKTGMSNIDIMNETTMPEKYGFSPLQIIDFKGLRGDASDNLPGIPGVGDKTAVKLIQDYGSFEKIVEAAKTMTSKVGQSIVENQDLGRHCYEMARIETNVELPFGIDDIIYKGYEYSKINAFCNSLDMKQLLNRLPVKLKKASEEDFEFKYEEVTSLDDLEVANEIAIALDIEPGNYNDATVYGMAIFTGSKLVYIREENFKNTQKFAEILKNSEIKKYCYDYKAIKVALSHLGFEIDGLYFDVLLCGYLLDTTLNNNADQIFGYLGMDISSNKQNELSLFDNSNPERTAKIAFASKRVANKCFTELEKLECRKLYEEVEIPLATVLAEIEIEGFPLHEEVLLKMGENYKVNLGNIRKRIYEFAGEEFNVDSPKQVADILYGKLQLADAEKEKSTSVEVLKHLVDKHPIVSEILLYRKYAKLLNTYVDGLIATIRGDGKIHAVFNQALTQTGRLSSSEPNLQNISVRDEEGKMIRKAFYYDDEDISILSLDYSQIELRILASLSGCKGLQEVFASGEDIHSATAKKVFKTDNPTPLDRRRAKAVNFGLIYGISEFGLSEQIGCTRKEAKEIMTNFFEAYPEINDYFRKINEEVNEKEYVSTLLGRKRYLREIHDTNYQVREFARRAAMNAPIQGTAADLIKIAMIRVNQALKEQKLESKIICQIHDELLLKVPSKEKEKVYDLVKNIMENAMKLDVKLEVDGGFGRTWYDCK